ncbi:MAG: hypothetical protein ABIJ16_11750 [Bacteroidota bacterium]
MMKIRDYRNIFFIVSLSVVFSIGFINCKGDGNTEDDIEDAIDAGIDSNITTLVKFNNTLFSIPSPYQVAYLIKEQKLDFNKEMLNPINMSHNYTNNFKKALNMGVYGADLGYLNIYGQTPDAVSYFSTIKILSQELNMTNAFDKKTIQSIENNMGNTDSLMYIISNAYRKGDEYLKDNGRENDGVLILAGGWIESIYIMTQIAATNPKGTDIITRIGEQKHPLDNLIKILSPYYNTSEEYGQLIDQLIDLAYEFDGIDITYTYEEPTVDVENKLTTINSKSELIMSDQQLQTISMKIDDIRKLIVE